MQYVMFLDFGDAWYASLSATGLRSPRRLVDLGSDQVVSKSFNNLDSTILPFSPYLIIYILEHSSELTSWGVCRKYDCLWLCLSNGVGGGVFVCTVVSPGCVCWW